MFKQRKIHQFIEKYGWELSDYGWGISDNDFSELEEFLNKIHGFLYVIKRINKLQRRDKEYVIQTLKNYKKYGFNEVQVEDILYDKINFIKNNKDTFKYPDLDHLYYAFYNYEDFYKKFIDDYQKERKEESTVKTLVSYYEVINKYYREFHSTFGEINCVNPVYNIEKYIFSLSPRCLCSFFEYAKENKIPNTIQRQFLRFSAIENDYFKNLSIRDFNDILEFVFKHNDIANQKDVVGRKLTMLVYFKDELSNNWNYLNALGNLPDDYILGIFKENNFLYDANFLNLLKESDNHIKITITNFIKEVGSHYNDKYYKILNSDIINRIGSRTLELVLDKIKEEKNEEESIAIEKIDFIMNCAILDDMNFITSSLSFIENDEDIRLISTKINCVKNIIPHIYNKEIPIKAYSMYLEILNYGLNTKTIEEQIDILEAKNKYFEKMDAYKKIGELDKSSISLLDSEDNRNDLFYNFISKTVDCYGNNTTKEIIERLSKIKDEDNKKMYIEFIIDEFFISSDDRRQKLLLNLFDNKSVSVDFGENNENVISVSPHVHNIVSNSNSPLEFVNKDTGLKIFVKRIKKD